ncbi:hypothetical protein pb186bvf_012528 [Paramecium bursaria]
MRRRTLSIQEDNLNLWTRNHQYQLSSSLDPTPKNQAIPGYGGFIPQLKAGNLHGRGYSPLTRVAFQIKIPKLDPPACSTSKYGQSTIQTILPQCSTSISAQSSYMDIYQDPKKQINPTQSNKIYQLSQDKIYIKIDGFRLQEKQ